VLRRFSAPAKLNLALVVGPRRPDGLHEVTTVYQRIDVCDRLTVERAAGLHVEGFRGDTIVRRALTALAETAGAEPAWRVRIWKQIPVASGLGGGSSDAATALRLANTLLPAPLSEGRLLELAASIGADVPFFLASGPQLGEGDGSALLPLDLPQDFWVVLVEPAGARKPSTAAVYADFDRRGAERGYEERRARLLAVLERVRRPRELSALPPNDLASSALADELRARGAFRADVTGAGPVVYGLFHRQAAARAAKRGLAPLGRTWLTVPAWYG
jgi:4-diphosphocytidyl-2-C-methyl-D-erythritol kinase